MGQTDGRTMNRYSASPKRGEDYKTLHRLWRIGSIREQLKDGQGLSELNAEYFNVETGEYTQAFIDRFFRKGTKNMTTEKINLDYERRVPR